MTQRTFPLFVPIVSAPVMSMHQRMPLPFRNEPAVDREGGDAGHNQ